MAASIFLKDCPECAATIPAEALRCSCGYRFDSGRADTTVDGLELIAQEERLYRDYLAARVQQAAKELEHARAVANAFPGDRVKTAELLLAEQRYNAARAALEAQNLRAQAVAARAKSAHNGASRKRAISPRSTVDRARLEHQRNGSPRKRATSPVFGLSQAAKPEKSKNDAATLHATAAKPGKLAVPKPATQVALPAAQSSPKPVDKTDPAPSEPAVVKVDPPPRQIATAEHTARAQAPVFREKMTAPKPAGQLSVPAANAARSSVLPHPSPTAAKAYAVMRSSAPSLSVNGSADALVTPGAGSPTPAPAFRAKQSARAQMTLVAFQQNATKDCPNCTANMPLQAARCRCGFEFPDSQSQIPPLVLSAEERNAILQALSGVGHKR